MYVWCYIFVKTRNVEIQTVEIQTVKIQTVEIQTVEILIVLIGKIWTTMFLGSKTILFSAIESINKLSFKR
jgi:hypothetical protein